jgi:hypothetical protein
MTEPGGWIGSMGFATAGSGGAMVNGAAAGVGFAASVFPVSAFAGSGFAVSLLAILVLASSDLAAFSGFAVSALEGSVLEGSVLAKLFRAASDLAISLVMSLAPSVLPVSFGADEAAGPGSAAEATAWVVATVATAGAGAGFCTVCGSALATGPGAAMEPCRAIVPVTESSPCSRLVTRE